MHERETEAGRTIPIREEHPQRHVHGLDNRTFELLESLLRHHRADAATLKRIERKVDAMALKLDKLQAGFDKIQATLDEIVKEFDDIRNNPADQAAVDAFGDKLAALAQSFSDINPDTPPTA